MSGRDSLTSSTPLSSTPGSPRLPQGLSRRQKKNRKRDKEEQRGGGGKKSSASPALSRNNSEDKCGGGGGGGAGAATPAAAAPLSRSKKRSTACKQVRGGDTLTLQTVTLTQHRYIQCIFSICVLHVTCHLMH